MGSGLGRRQESHASDGTSILEKSKKKKTRPRQRAQRVCVYQHQTNPPPASYTGGPTCSSRNQSWVYDSIQFSLYTGHLLKPRR